MRLICSKCGKEPGPLTAEFFPDSSCLCGGRFGEIDEDIIKALMPFAPAKEKPTFFEQMAVGAILAGAFLAFGKR